MSDRTVKVTLKSDVAEYTAGLARAAAETRGLGDESRKASTQTRGVGDESRKAAPELRRLADAAGAAQLAQLRLNEAREKGKASGSTMLSLTQRLEKAQRDLAEAQQVATKATGDHSVVQRTLAESMARAARSAAVQAELEKSGEDDGSTLARGVRQGLVRNSPLIAAAIGGTLAAGAPLAIAGATALFGGIAAVAVHSNEQVRRAAVDLANDAMGTFKTAAAQTVPFFTSSLQRMSLAIMALEPQLRGVFGSLADPINLLTTGIINMANNAMPGMEAAAKAATPVFQGLAALLGSIGTGLSDFMSILAEHGPAAGKVFASLGDILRNLLPALGELVGAGVELASQILPPMASALGVVNDVLHAIEPVLPGILAGFLGFKAIQALNGPLTWFAGKLENLGSLGSKAGGALSGLAGALPGIGVAAGIVGFAFEQQSAQIDKWATALNNGGTAADQAKKQMQDLANAVTYLGTGANGVVADFLGYGTALNVASQSSDKAKQAAQDQLANMTPLEKAQQKVTQATNDYTALLDKYGPKAGVVVAASYTLRDAQAELTHQQELLKAAQDGVSLSMEQNRTRLDGIATAAGQANTEINLFKSALDALTGTYVSQVQAEAAVTQAVDAAKQSIKGKTGALVDDTGALNTHTEAGAAAGLSLTNLATIDNNLISTLVRHGATSDQVAAKDAELRDQFIKTAEQMGFTAGQANNLADQILGIPEQRKTEIIADTGQAQATIDKFIAGINSQGLIGIIRTIGGRADGGIVDGPGGERSDSILGIDRSTGVPTTWVSNKEFVVNARATAKHRATLERINADGLPGHADGGYIGYPSDADFIGFTDMTPDAQSKLAAAKAKATATFTGGPSVGVGIAGSINRALGLSIASAMGYASQFAAIDYIFSRESGWRNTAQNPTSSAYGIPQFLNATWAAYGGKTSDPATQIRDGIRYMVDRYGSPNAAAAFWQAHHWYANGGMINEPVAGVGLSSGDRYMLGERGPEMVTPIGVSGRSGTAGDGVAVAVSIEGAQIVGVLDLGDGLEARIDGRIVGALSSATTRARNNRR